MSSWDRFSGEVCGVVSETRRAGADTIAMLHRAMSVYSDGIEITPSGKRKDSRLLQMGFLSQSFNSLFAATDAAVNGLYFQSLGLMRFVLESWATYWYLEKFPNEADRWLSDLKEKQPPTVETMLKKIDHPTKDTKKNAKGHRSTLNRFVHSDSFAVHYLLEVEKSAVAVRWGVVFDHGKFEACCLEIALWLGNMLDALSRGIPASHKWHKSYSGVASEILEFADQVQERARRKTSN